MGYALRENVHYCVTNGQVALLDLVSDRYFGLPPRLDQAFQRLASGAILTSDETEALAGLVERQILIEASSARFSYDTPELPIPESSIVDEIDERADFILTAEALIGQLGVASALKRKGLYKLVRDLRHLKQHLPSRTAAPSNRALSAVLSTRRVLPSQNQCLRWSIAMTRFLLHHGASVDLVIGVATKPFRAHAWVQGGSTVYSDRLDTVARFTPILVV